MSGENKFQQDSQSMQEIQSPPTVTASQSVGTNTASGNPDRISVTVQYNDSNRLMENTVVFDIDHDGNARVSKVSGEGSIAQKYIPIAFAANKLRENPAVADIVGVPPVEYVYSHITEEVAGGEHAQSNNNAGGDDDTRRQQTDTIEADQQNGDVEVEQNSAQHPQPSQTSEPSQTSGVNNPPTQQPETTPSEQQHSSSPEQPQTVSTNQENNDSDVDVHVGGEADPDPEDNMVDASPGREHSIDEVEEEGVEEEGVEEEGVEEEGVEEEGVEEEGLMGVEAIGGWESVSDEDADFRIAFSHEESEDLISVWDTHIVVGEEKPGMSDFTIHYEDNDTEQEDEQKLVDTIPEVKDTLHQYMEEKPQ